MLYYHVVGTFTLQCIKSLSISNSNDFLHTFLNPLTQTKFDFNSRKQTFVCIQLVEMDFGRSFFPDIICAKGK